jgi:hypothetical protein
MQEIGVRKLVVACVVMALGAASVAEAQATRTWVSGVGDDVNPCSRTAPCKTFAGAISKTAEFGEINVLDPGGFGAVTITKSITIDGGGAMAGVLTTLGSSGIIVNAGADDIVILRNLSLDGVATGGNGIRVISAKQVHVEHCTIFGFASNGILFNAAAGNLFVSDTTIKQVPSQGVYVQSGTAMLNRVTLTGNQFGLLAGLDANVTVKQSVASGNGTGFAAAYSAGSQLTLEDTLTSNNQYGVMVLSGAIVRLSNVTLTGNYGSAMYNDGTGRLVTFGNNRFAGNAADGVFNGTLTVR